MKKKKTAPAKRAAKKTARVVVTSSAFIVRSLSDRHAKILEDFRAAQPGRSKSTSGALGEVLDHYAALSEDAQRLTLDRNTWEDAARAYAAATKRGADAMVEEERALNNLLKLAQRRPGSIPRQLVISE